jgi:hypothetical protein
MGAQTIKDNYILPDGTAFEVSTDSGSSWSNLGVVEGGAVVTHNYDKIEFESGNAGKTCARAKNETLAMAPTPLITWDMESLQTISGNLFTYTAVAGTPVAGATQAVTSGNWSFNKGILLKGQNSSGAAPTINSVTGSVDGPGAADDYDTALLPGGWHLIPRDGTNFTTASQNLTIDYDYTPAASTKITSGQTSFKLERYQVRFRHYTDDALTTWDFQMTAFGVDMDSGLAFNFKGQNEDGWNNITVAMTANIDTSLTSGAQLFELELKSSAVISC